MYSAVLWPSQNEEGLGEVDLEILSKQDGIIQGPIWKPGDADTPIPFSNPPEKWAGQTPVDPAGPSLTIGDGVQSVLLDVYSNLTDLQTTAQTWRHGKPVCGGRL